MLGEIVSAIEFLDGQSLNMVLTLPNKKNPFSQEYPFYMLIETSGSNEKHDKEKIENFLSHLMSGDNQLILDGVLAESKSQVTQM